LWVLRARHSADRWDKEGFDEAISLLDPALDLDPKDTLGHIALGRVRLGYDWDWAAAEKCSAGYQRVHVCLHALLGFVRPVSAGFQLAGASRPRHLRALDFPRGHSYAWLQLERHAS
jgi:hypothetical protein